MANPIDLERIGYNFVLIGNSILRVVRPAERIIVGSHRYECRTVEEIVNEGDADLMDLAPYDFNNGVRQDRGVIFERKIKR